VLRARRKVDDVHLATSVATCPLAQADGRGYGQRLAVLGGEAVLHVVLELQLALVLSANLLHPALDDVGFDVAPKGPKGNILSEVRGEQCGEKDGDEKDQAPTQEPHDSVFVPTAHSLYQPFSSTSRQQVLW
jgi:hypothetical protein